MWHDAFHLKHALRCIRSVQPVRWAEVRDALRKSRRFRRQFLADARGNIMFRISCIWEGIKP